MSRVKWPWSAVVRRVVLAPFSSSGLVWLVGLTWFAGAYAAIVWVWGIDPVVFPSSDEAVVRFAARLISKGHGPFLPLPFPDPEDLLHPRSWVSLEYRATPAYAPVSFYLYGWLLRLGSAGPVVITCLAASGIAAFAAGTARLLRGGRRWLAIVAPGLAFPAVYWTIRTWINVSPLLISVGWSFYFWAAWRETGRVRQLAGSIFILGFGAAVRPDYAGYLLLVMLCFSVAARPARWKMILSFVTVSGALALSANLILNRIITGHATQAAYQIAVDRQWGPDTEAQGIPGLGLLRALLLPMGMPTWAVGVTAFRKYWLTMGPIAWILVGQLAIVPLLFKGSWLSRALRVTAILVVTLFMVSRLQDGLFGSTRPIGEVHHSVARYLSPVYLLAALPPVLLVARLRSLYLFVPAALGLTLFAASACYDVAIEQRASFLMLHQFVEDKSSQLASLSRKIPPDATVYTAKEDKWIWSRWRVATLDDPNATANSIERSLQAGMSLFVLEPKRTRALQRLTVLLRRRQIELVRLDSRRGLYRVSPPPAP